MDFFSTTLKICCAWNILWDNLPSDNLLWHYDRRSSISAPLFSCFRPEPGIKLAMVCIFLSIALSTKIGPRSYGRDSKSSIVLSWSCVQPTTSSWVCSWFSDFSWISSCAFKVTNCCTLRVFAELLVNRPRFLADFYFAAEAWGWSDGDKGYFSKSNTFFNFDYYFPLRKVAEFIVITDASPKISPYPATTTLSY